MSDELKKRIFTSILLLSLLSAMYLYSFVMITGVIIIALIIWIEFYALISKILKKNRFKERLLQFFYKAISLLYLSLFTYLIFMIESYYINLKIYLLYSVLVSVLTDIDQNFLTLVIITITISLISQIGDLFISYLKRKAKVKNTSDLLPGHGGFLDRVDGIIFAMPLGILLLGLF